MLSTLIQTTHAHQYLFNENANTAKENDSLVNVHYQENNYLALLNHIQTRQVMVGFYF